MRPARESRAIALPAGAARRWPRRRQARRHAARGKRRRQGDRHQRRIALRRRRAQPVGRRDRCGTTAGDGSRARRALRPGPRDSRPANRLRVEDPIQVEHEQRTIGLERDAAQQVLRRRKPAWPSERRRVHRGEPDHALRLERAHPHVGGPFDDEPLRPPSRGRDAEPEREVDHRDDPTPEREHRRSRRRRTGDERHGPRLEHLSDLARADGAREPTDIEREDLHRREATTASGPRGWPGPIRQVREARTSRCREGGTEPQRSALSAFFMSETARNTVASRPPRRSRTHT